MGTLSSSNALTDSRRRRLFLKRRYGLDIRSDLNGMRISWAVSVGEWPGHGGGVAGGGAALPPDRHPKHGDG